MFKGTKEEFSVHKGTHKHTLTHRPMFVCGLLVCAGRTQHLQGVYNFSNYASRRMENIEESHSGKQVGKQKAYNFKSGDVFARKKPTHSQKSPKTKLTFARVHINYMLHMVLKPSIRGN